MSAYKQFLASDITVVPFEVNKGFSYKGSELTGSDVAIDRYQGTNLSGTLFNPTTDPITGQVSIQYQRLVYDSVQELYYSNYLSSSYGSPATTGSIFPGANTEGDVLVGPLDSSGRYFNYNQTTLTFEKYFPTGSGVSGSIYDDGQGNLLLSPSDEICGQIFYPHGIAVITSDSNPGGNGYGVAQYGSAVYGVGDATIVDGFINSPNVTCSFSSSITIYETQYKCTIRENEFTLTLNPSALSDSSGSMYGFVTASYFNPYVTTVGLYDDEQNLLAIGKLSQPLPTSPTTDTTILINLDR